MKHLLYLFVILFSQSISAQYDEVLNLLYQRKISTAEEIIKTKYDGDDKQLLKAKLALENKNLAQSFKLLFEIDTLQLSPYQKGFYYNFLAQTYDSNTEMDEAIKNFYAAQKIFKKEELLHHYNQINLDLYYLYIASETESLIKNAPVLLVEFNQLAQELNNPQQRIQAYIDLGFESLEQSDLEEFNRLFDLGFDVAKNSKDQIGTAKLHSYKGLVYGEILEDFDIAEFHYDTAIQIYDSIENGYKKKPLLMNKSDLYAKQGKFEKSVSYLLEAEQQPDATGDAEISLQIYRRLADAYESLGKIDSALYYNKKTIKQIEIINENQQLINITRFEAEKKEKENILLQERNTKNLYVLFFLGVVLVVLVLITYLIYSNAKRKQLLLSKKQEIAEQKNQRLIKEQELTSIDAMLEGQDRERQRMASDLHNNIGASLTSVKMYFNQIKEQIKNKKFDEAVFHKTDTLLDETYQEIRSLAHLKNAGVLAQDGLIPALKNLVEKSSYTSNFKIELSLHELNNRLPNSLEIGIFRIIQELITNVIKHAKATQAIITLTNHGDFLNIIVEDDGVGFQNNPNSNEGMGLASIKKKVAYFKGEIDIDSNKEMGTTILIDLPL